MALLLSLPVRAPTASRTAHAAIATAEIIILPCVRRERMDHGPADFAQIVDDLPTQRQA